jgi:hypothetical protein
MDIMSKRAELLCVFRGADTEWEAICLDFDIAVHGESLSQVRDLLIYAVNSYIDGASHENEPNKTKLLSRRVPLHVRLRWAIEFLFHSVTNRRPETEGRFVLPCHA